MDRGTVIEYVWLSFGVGLKSKTRIVNEEAKEVEELPLMGCGNFARKGETKLIDCAIKPKRLYSDPFRVGQHLALSELYIDFEATLPHVTNHRIELVKLLNKLGCEDLWVGFEQEFIFFDPCTNSPLGFRGNAMMDKLDNIVYSCEVGSTNSFGREIMEEFMVQCKQAGITLYGYCGERSPSQWEFQTQPFPVLKACDDLIMARYILGRCAEKKHVDVNYHPKVSRTLHSSGLHVNISSQEMRSEGGLKAIERAVDQILLHNDRDIQFFGEENELRLTGTLLCAKAEDPSVGVGDRTSSIRIPKSVQTQGKGYFEDRRPASNADPYLVMATLLKSMYSESNNGKSHSK